MTRHFFVHKTAVFLYSVGIMLCLITKMRTCGVPVPKRSMPQEPRHRGDLSIGERKSDDLQRVVRYARLEGHAGEPAFSPILYDPQVLWMHDDRFVLTGFERVTTLLGVADHMQSWLREIVKP